MGLVMVGGGCIPPIGWVMMVIVDTFCIEFGIELCTSWY